MPFPTMSLRSAMIRILLIGVPLSPLGGCDRQSATNEQAAAPSLPAAPAPMAASARIDRSHKGEPAPALGFADPDGRPATLAGFKGKPVLVNLWATWCGPCIKEMPTLDAAAAAIPVAAISQDQDRATVTAFFAAHRFARLQPYLDQDTGLSIAFDASLPMSILYDSSGHEVWRTMGGMDWTGAEAKGLLAEAR